MVQQTSVTLNDPNWRPNLGELYQGIDDVLHQVDTPAFQEALVSLAAGSAAHLREHLTMEHSIPSPSTITDCRFATWCKGTGVPSTGVIPTSWTKRSVAGTLIEPFWIAVLNLTGMLPPVNKVDSAKPAGPHMLGMADIQIGDHGLGEFKDRSGWMYKRILEDGIVFAEPKTYMQIQQYLFAYDRQWALLLASAADPGMLQGQMRRFKNYGPEYNLPVAYLEVIERDDEAIARGQERAYMMANDKKSSSPPPREYDGRVHDKGMHPCNICRFVNTCQETWG